MDINKDFEHYFYAGRIFEVICQKTREAKDNNVNELELCYGVCNKYDVDWICHVLKQYLYSYQIKNVRFETQVLPYGWALKIYWIIKENE